MSFAAVSVGRKCDYSLLCTLALVRPHRCRSLQQPRRGPPDGVVFMGGKQAMPGEGEGSERGVAHHSMLDLWSSTFGVTGPTRQSGTTARTPRRPTASLRRC